VTNGARRAASTALATLTIAAATAAAERPAEAAWTRSQAHVHWLIWHTWRKHGQPAGPALRVGWCESRYHRKATNGQYRGVFQLSASWRGYFGIGSGYRARRNVRAAYRIWAGQGWAPWECQP
jgi:hypothetical protein